MFTKSVTQMAPSGSRYRRLTSDAFIAQCIIFVCCIDVFFLRDNKLAGFKMVHLQATFVRPRPVLVKKRNIIQPAFNCTRLQKALGRYVNCQDKCIYVEQYGRWGNQILGLRRVMEAVDGTGIERLTFEPNHASFRNITKWHGIELNPSPHGSFRCARVNGFYPFKTIRYINLTFDDEFKEIYAEQMKEYIPTLGDDDLVIHIRSGDLFEVEHSIPPDYGQPMCSYYTDIIKSRKWSRVLLYAEDHNNPCVGVVEAAGGEFQNVTFEHVLGAGVAARNLVFGRGTLGPALAGIAQRLDRLYTFNMPTGQFNAREHMNCVSDEDYNRNVLNNFRCSPEQLEYMKTAKCARWDRIEYDPGPRNMFVHDVYM